MSIDINPRNLLKKVREQKTQLTNPISITHASKEHIADAIKFVEMVIKGIDGRYRIEIYKVSE